MATTALSLISDALRLINVLAETETATAEQSALGVRVINEMLASWEADSVDIGWLPVEEASESVSTDSVHDSAIKYNLAHELSRYFSRATPPEVFERAVAMYSRIVRNQMVDALQPVQMDHIPRGVGSRSEDFDFS